MDKAIEYLVSDDAIMKNILDQYGKPYIPSRPEGFQTLAKLILEQQVSLASAKACYLKLETYLKEITPETILNASEEELRNNAVSRQKVVYLKALANAVLDENIDLESYAVKSSEEIRRELIKIKGIGDWTVDVYLMFSLHKEDVVPLGDIAIKNTIKELYNCQTDEEILKVSERWKPYRTMASFFLWHYYLEKRNRKPLVY